jgi:hypothetical protein
LRLLLAYTAEDELKPLLPLLNGEVARGVELEPKKVSVDEVKFNHGDFDLFFIHLPLFLYVKGVKVISNGAYVLESLGIEGDNYSSVCVDSSSSTEFYLVKLLLNPKAIPKRSGDCSRISREKGNLSELWKEECGDLPIVISLIGSTRLSTDDLLKLKVVIRESASIQERKGEIKSYSKELGLKGREALDCFFKLCKKKGVCGEVTYDLL